MCSDESLYVTSFKRKGEEKAPRRARYFRRGMWMSGFWKQQRSQLNFYTILHGFQYDKQQIMASNPNYSIGRNSVMLLENCVKTSAKVSLVFFTNCNGSSIDLRRGVYLNNKKFCISFNHADILQRGQNFISCCKSYKNMAFQGCWE